MSIDAKSSPHISNEKTTDGEDFFIVAEIKSQYPLNERQSVTKRTNGFRLNAS